MKLAYLLELRLFRNLRINSLQSGALLKSIAIHSSEVRTLAVHAVIACVRTHVYVTGMLGDVIGANLKESWTGYHSFLPSHIHTYTCIIHYSMCPPRTIHNIATHSACSCMQGTCGALISFLRENVRRVFVRNVNQCLLTRKMLYELSYEEAAALLAWWSQLIFLTSNITLSIKAITEPIYQCSLQIDE